MATARQIEANRQNAQKSTGPLTDEGKEIARGNSFRHGMSATGPVANAKRAALVAERKRTFHLELAPQGTLKAFLVDQIAETSVCINVCVNNLNTAFDRTSRIALFGWDDDRQHDVALLAGSLPGKPEQVIWKLKKTRHGCEYLINRWGVLAGILQRKSVWDAELRSQALDMLGVEHAHRTGPTALDPAEGTDELTHLLDLIQAQLNGLRDKVSRYLAEEDVYDRKQALEGVDVFRSRDVQLIMRYRGSMMRDMFKLLKEFHRKPKSASNIHPSLQDDDDETDEVEFQAERELNSEPESEAASCAAAPESELFPVIPVTADEGPTQRAITILNATVGKRPGERLEDMSPARLRWLQGMGQMPLDAVVPNQPPVGWKYKPTDEQFAFSSCETKPISVGETNPISPRTFAPMVLKTTNSGQTRPMNRAARRQLARRVATSGR